MVKENEKSMRLNIERNIDDSYDLMFDMSFPSAAADLKRRGISKRLAIITDTNVGPLYAESLQLHLAENGLESMIFTFDAGEQNKNWDTCGKLLGEMAKAKYGRDSSIIALGGGVVGDTAGFIAAITRRGIPYVQIPTSTISWADSSIGGKTGVDLPEGKNLVGAFKQPAVVYFIMETLDTLPQTEYISGLAETVKHGVIRDKKLFEYLEQNAHLVLERDKAVLGQIARANCLIKGAVVEIDPNEKGLRRILNYGHTIGHAVEKLSGYSLSHGECVAIGMMAAGKIAVALETGFTDDDLQRQYSLLQRLGMPTAIPQGIPNGAILEVTSLDKKAKDGMARYVLPCGIGAMCEYGGVWATYVDNSVVMAALRGMG